MFRNLLYFATAAATLWGLNQVLMNTSAARKVMYFAGRLAFIGTTALSLSELRSGPNPVLSFISLALGTHFYFGAGSFKNMLSGFISYRADDGKQIGIKETILTIAGPAALSLLAYPLIIYPIGERIAKAVGGFPELRMPWPFTSALSNPRLQQCFSNLKDNLSTYSLGTVVAGATAIGIAKLWYDAIKLINEPQSNIDVKEAGKPQEQKDAANDLRAFLQSNSLLVYGSAITTTSIIAGVGLFAQTRAHNPMLAAAPIFSYLATSNITHYLDYKPGNTILGSVTKTAKRITDSIATTVGAYLG